MDEQSKRRWRKDGFIARTKQCNRVLDVVFEADECDLLGQGNLLALLGERRVVSTSQLPIRDFEASIVEAHTENADDTDTIVEAASEDRAMSRVNVVDRSTLRMVVAEFVYVGTGRSHVIPEWASLAREYSTERSVDFVMEVLNQAVDIRVCELAGGCEPSESEEVGGQEAN